jgi:hypothetical protein
VEVSEVKCVEISEGMSGDIRGDEWKYRRG